MIGITYVRELLNLTLEELANKLGLTKQAISIWERGKSQIAENRLQQLEDLFQIPKDYFSREVDEIDKLEIQKYMFESKGRIEKREITDVEGIKYSYEEKVYEPDVEEKIKLLDIELSKAKVYKEIDDILNVKQFINIDEYINKTFEAIGAYRFLNGIVKSKKVPYETLTEILNAIILGYEIEVGFDNRSLAREITAVIKNDRYEKEIDYIIHNLLINSENGEDEKKESISKLFKIRKETSYFFLKSMINNKLYKAYMDGNIELLNKMKELVGISKTEDIDIEELKLFDEL